MPQPNPSPLLRLPCELRLEIYSYLFQVDSKPRIIHLQCPSFLPFHYIPPQKQWHASHATAKKEAEHIGNPSCNQTLPHIASSRYAILLTCSQINQEARKLYMSTFTLTLDSPIEYIPRLLHLEPLSSPWLTSLKTLSLSRHLIRPLDPTASARAKAWKSTCMSMSPLLPRIEELWLELTGDIGTITMGQGRRNVFEPLVECGWFSGKTKGQGCLRHLWIIWVDEGWGLDGQEAVTILREGASRVHVEKSGESVRWVFELEGWKGGDI